MNLAFSVFAQSDIDNALLYTTREWGRAQRAIYKKQLDSALGLIVSMPNIGRRLRNHDEDIFVYPVGKHRIFYKIVTGGIHILRVLHERMDVPKHLEG